MVRDQFPAVHLTALSDNRGFAAASNLGIRAGVSPYVLLLNPDTRVARGSLDAMLDVVERHPEVGIAGCRLVRDDGSEDHAAHRNFPTIAAALGHFLGIGSRRWAPHPMAQYVAPGTAGPVDAVSGAFMLIRRRALSEVGLLDEGYWMYMEDLDICYRFRSAGWTTWYEPSVTVAHVKHGTSGEIRSARLNYAFHYGMIRFYRKHYAPGRPSVANGIVYGGIATKLLVSTVRCGVLRLLSR